MWLLPRLVTASRLSPLAVASNPYRGEGEKRSVVAVRQTSDLERHRLERVLTVRANTNLHVGYIEAFVGIVNPH